MIIGIGTDITRIARIEETLAAQGDRFKERCFAPEERAHVEKNPDVSPAGGYAKRWAAKEATAKALGLGIRDGIYLKDIVILNDDAGRPTLSLQGGAAARLAAILPEGAVADLHVSLSDEGGMAIAFVVISAVADKDKPERNKNA